MPTFHFGSRRCYLMHGLHGGNISDFAQRYRIPVGRILDFSANINPLGLPGKVRSIIQKNIAALIHYPEAESKSLKKDLARLHHLKAENILLGNGSTELIHLIPYALKVKRVLIALPAFSEYEFAAKNSKARVKFIPPLNDGRLKIDIAKILKAIPRAELVFVANPNNPTGELLSKQEMLLIIKKCSESRALLVIDEVFLDFAEHPDDFTMLTQLPGNKYTIVIRSLTKLFAIAGLRLGYLAGHSALIRKISHFQYPWAVNSLAQAVGRTVIRDRHFVKRSKEYISQERNFLLEELKKIKGISVYPSQANFIFCRLNHQFINAPRLSCLLARSGIMVRDCSNFRGLNTHFFRVAVRTRPENLKLLNGLREVLN